MTDSRILSLLGFIFVNVVRADDKAPSDISAVMFATSIPIVVVFVVLICWSQHREIHKNNNSASVIKPTITAAARSKEAAALMMAEAVPELRSMEKSREVNNLWHLHTWVRLILSNDHSLRFYSHLSDVHMLLYSFVHVISAMLVTTILYDVTEPSDDYCYEQTLKSDCLADSTAFVHFTNRCHWADGGGCSFRFVKDSLVDIFFAALVVCFCTAGLMLLWEPILKVLSGAVIKRSSIDPPGESAGLNPKREKHLIECSTMRRCLSRAVSSGTQACDTDFNTINQEIRRLQNILPNGSIRLQFCAAWGVSNLVYVDKMPLPEPMLDVCRDDLSPEQIAANTTYLNLLRAHKESDIHIARVKDFVCAYPPTHGDPQNSDWAVFFDVIFLRALLSDLLPPREAAVISASLDRQNPPPVIVRNRFWQPTLATCLLLYIFGSIAYLLSLAYFRSHRWQLVWLVTLVFWWAVDLVIVQPLMLVIQGYLIPLVAKEKCKKAENVILQNILLLDNDECVRIYDENLDELPALPSQGEEQLTPSLETSLGLLFFASARLAMQKAMPTSRAADLIAKFSNPYPRYVSTYIDPDTDIFTERCRKELLSVTLTILAFFESFPFAVSAFILQVILVGLLWLLFYAHVQLSESDLSPGVWAPSVLVFILLAASVSYVLFGSLKVRRRKIAPKSGEERNEGSVPPYVDAADAADAADTADAAEGQEWRSASPAPQVEESQQIVTIPTASAPSAPSAETPVKEERISTRTQDYDNDFFDSESEKSYSIVTLRTRVSSVSVDFIDHYDSEGEKSVDDLKSYTVRLSVSSHSSSSSISVDIDPEHTSSEESNLAPAEEEDDEKTYSIVTSHSQATSVSLDYGDDFEAAEDDDKSYTVALSVSHHSSRSSLSVGFERHPSEPNFEPEAIVNRTRVACSDVGGSIILMGDTIVSDEITTTPAVTRNRVAFSDTGSMVIMGDTIVSDEITTVPVRQYGSFITPNRVVQRDEVVEISEAWKTTGSSFASSMIVVNESVEESVDHFSDDDSVFSVAVVAQDLKRYAGKEDGKPKVTFSISDVQEEESPAKSRPLARLPAASYLSPKRVLPKDAEPVVVKPPKSFGDIYGVKKKPKRKKQDVLRQRLNAKLRKEEEIKEAREKLEDVLKPPSPMKNSPTKSPGAEYENESFEVGHSTHSMRVASPRSQKRAKKEREIKDGSVWSVDTDADAVAFKSEQSVVEPSVVEPSVVEPDVVEPDVVEPNVVEPDVVEQDLSIIKSPESPEKEIPTPVEPTIQIDTAATPEKPHSTTNKTSFFKKLWSHTKKAPALKGNRSEKRKPAKKSPQVLKKKAGVRVTWNSMRNKFRRKKEPALVEEEKDTKHDTVPQHPISYQSEFVTPKKSPRNAPDASVVLASKAQTDSVKKSHSSVYQSRISWNAVKKRLIRAKNDTTPSPSKQLKPIVILGEGINNSPVALGNGDKKQHEKEGSLTKEKIQWKPVSKNVYHGASRSTSWSNIKSRIISFRGGRKNSPSKKK